MQGLDIRRYLVLRVAGGRRLDVHGVDIEFMRHQLGQVLGCDQASELSPGKYPLAGMIVIPARCRARALPVNRSDHRSSVMHLMSLMRARARRAQSSRNNRDDKNVRALVITLVSRTMIQWP